MMWRKVKSNEWWCNIIISYMVVRKKFWHDVCCLHDVMGVKLSKC